MESKRQQKFAKLIQKELSSIFQHDVKGLFGGAFITVTVVRMSPDLGAAKVYLSFLMTKEREALLKKVKDQYKPIRKMLGEKIGKQVRVIPELFFYIDDTLDYVERIENIVSKLNIPPADPEDKTDAKDEK